MSLTTTNEQARMFLAGQMTYALAACGNVWTSEHDEEMGEARVIDAEDNGPGQVVICETDQWPDDEERCDTALHIAANDPKTVLILSNAMLAIIDLGGVQAEILIQAVGDILE